MKRYSIYSFVVLVVFFALFTFLIAGCSQDPGGDIPGPQGKAGSNGANSLIKIISDPSDPSCQLFEVGLDLNHNGVLDPNEINSIYTICNGTNGSQGIAGTNGVNGTNGQNGAIGQAGTNGIDGTNGTNGVNGTNGTNGTNGLNSLLNLVSDPTGCNGVGGTIILEGLDLNNDGTLENSEVIESTEICNGVTGAQGQQGIAGQTGATGSQGQQGIQGVTGATGATGPQGSQGVAGTNATEPQFTPVIIITPCGSNSATYKEAFLGLVGGDVFSEFTGGSSTDDVANVILPDGSYEDTDASQCNFTVSTDTNGNRTISWAAQTCANGYKAVAGSYNYNALTETWSYTP